MPISIVGFDPKERKPTGLPKCPNHGCSLEGMPWPMPKKGTARCPVSGAHFSYEVEVDEMHVEQDKDGNIQKVVRWKAEGNE